MHFPILPRSFIHRDQKKKKTGFYAQRNKLGNLTPKLARVCESRKNKAKKKATMRAKASRHNISQRAVGLRVYYGERRDATLPPVIPYCEILIAFHDLPPPNVRSHISYFTIESMERKEEREREKETRRVHQRKFSFAITTMWQGRSRRPLELFSLASIVTKIYIHIYWVNILCGAGVSQRIKGFVSIVELPQIRLPLAKDLHETRSPSRYHHHPRCVYIYIYM